MISRPTESSFSADFVVIFVSGFAIIFGVGFSIDFAIGFVTGLATGVFADSLAACAAGFTSFAGFSISVIVGFAAGFDVVLCCVGYLC